VAEGPEGGKGVAVLVDGAPHEGRGLVLPEGRLPAVPFAAAAHVWGMDGGTAGARAYLSLKPEGGGGGSADIGIAAAAAGCGRETADRMPPGAGLDTTHNAHADDPNTGYASPVVKSANSTAHQ